MVTLKCSFEPPVKELGGVLGLLIVNCSELITRAIRSFFGGALVVTYSGSLFVNLN